MASQASAGNAELAKAVRQGSDKAAAMIASGVGVNEADDKGRGPLYYACQRGDADLVGALAAKGADVNAQDPLGDTPLMVLVRNTFDVYGATQTLVGHGANLNLRNKAGRTALMEAVLRAPGVLDYQAQTRLVKALIDAGADAGLSDSDGAMALHHAAKVGEPVSMFKIVLAATHDAHRLDGEGLDALMIAARYDHRPVALQMFQAGWIPSFALTPVAMPATDPTRLDERARADAISLTWYGDYLTQQNHQADAISSDREALKALDGAVAEEERVAGVMRKVLAVDERKRDDAKAAAFVATVAGAALLATTGTGAYFILTPSATVEQDKQRLKAIATEEAALTAQRDELTKRLKN